MGRSRGGNTTKIHAIVDRNGLPIALKLTEGQAHDGKTFEQMMSGIGEGVLVLADRAYDSNAIREKLEARGALANIRPLDCRVEKPVFSPRAYKLRNLVERFFSELTTRQLKRLAVTSVAQLIETITHYIDRRNEHPKPFVWTASPKSIVAKIKKAKETLATQH